MRAVHKAKTGFLVDRDHPSNGLLFPAEEKQLGYSAPSGKPHRRKLPSSVIANQEQIAPW